MRAEQTCYVSMHESATTSRLRSQISIDLGLARHGGLVIFAPHAGRLDQLLACHVHQSKHGLYGSAHARIVLHSCKSGGSIARCVLLHHFGTLLFLVGLGTTWQDRVLSRKMETIRPKRLV